jgi:hypothetical protein
MKTAAALLLSFFALTAAAAPCKPPKIIGLDYHTARAMLIKAGCRPVAYDPAKEGGRPAPEVFLELGYIEAGHSNNAGRIKMQWQGFTVEAKPCETFNMRCKVLSIDHH